ncbi:unnamed protein product, partial [Didymodactylos carnosus]
ALINTLLDKFRLVDAQAQISDVVTLFGFQRYEFLLECLKQLQSLEKYAKIDLITVTQEAIQFDKHQLTRD